MAVPAAAMAARAAAAVAAEWWQEDDEVLLAELHASLEAGRHCGFAIQVQRVHGVPCMMFTLSAGRTRGPRRIFLAPRRA